MLRFSRAAITVPRRMVSAAPKTTTGIEHADEFKKIGEKHQMEQNKYKVVDYYSTNQWSYYKKEEDMASMRCQQPNNQKPDTQPKVTKQPDNQKSDTQPKDAKK